MAATNTLSEAVYPVTGKEIPEILPGVSIGFRVCGSVTLAYLWNEGKVRIGTANCSMKDKYNQVYGEKVALKRAFEQFDFSDMVRTILWEQYLVSRGIIKPSIIRLFVIQAIEDMKHARQHN